MKARRCLAVAVAAFASLTGVASAEAPQAYLHNLAAPPLCAVVGTTPDPSLTICQARFFGPVRMAPASESVLLRIGDFESTQADCTAFSRNVTTTFMVDGTLVPVTTQPCRYIPAAVEDLAGSLPTTPVWGTEFRYLIPAGSLLPGVHSVTWTATYDADVSYSLGCGDPSGRCTVPAGSVFTNTHDLVIGG